MIWLFVGIGGLAVVVIVGVAVLTTKEPEGMERPRERVVFKRYED